MPVTTIGTAGVIWGLSAETGIIAQSVSAKTTREKNQVRNESGEFVAVAFYNATQTFSVSGIMTGASGLASAAPGVAMSLTNTATSNGVTQGLIVVDDVDVSKGNTEFKKISINATQYPLITS